MKRRYEMGVMDLYPVIANKTQIENNPFLQARFTNEVDVNHLYDAVKVALAEHPLFSCTLRYQKGFYLETNDAEVILFHTDERNRPLSFGDHTNRFLWQMCYDDHSVMFEWCHAISDGRGGFNFFSSVLCHYFGVEKPVPQTFLDLKGLEYISSAGLRVLLSAQKKMQKIGSMKVVNVCETVMEVFEMTGFADILVIE